MFNLYPGYLFQNPSNKFFTKMGQPKNKAMEDFFNNMPNPDAMFQSWWPFLIAGGAGTLYGFRSVYGCWRSEEKD